LHRDSGRLENKPIGRAFGLAFLKAIFLAIGEARVASQMALASLVGPKAHHFSFDDDQLM